MQYFTGCQKIKNFLINAGHLLTLILKEAHLYEKKLKLMKKNLNSNK